MLSFGDLAGLVFLDDKLFFFFLFSFSFTGSIACLQHLLANQREGTRDGDRFVHGYYKSLTIKMEMEISISARG